MQWRSAQALSGAGGIDAPGGLRALIGAVHGDDPLEVPDALADVEIETYGTTAAQTGRARLNLLNPTQAFSAMEQAYDDQIYPTRLGDPQMTLVLTRRIGGKLVPWAGDGLHPVRAIALSGVPRPRGDEPIA